MERTGGGGGTHPEDQLQVGGHALWTSDTHTHTRRLTFLQINIIIPAVSLQGLQGDGSGCVLKEYTVLFVALVVKQKKVRSSSENSLPLVKREEG